VNVSKTSLLIALALAATTSLSARATIGYHARDDAKIEAEVEASIDANPALGSALLIDVQSIDHVVYLHGLVDSFQEKSLVQSIAAQTPGVARVVNSIEMQNN
jgi:osmotically-inducible protein OsmY